MTKVLGVVGSPRRNGNTHVLVSSVLDAAVAAGAQADLLLLGGSAIRECDGCHACWKGKPCPKDDDMTAIYGRIADCDAIVFGTPVYWYGPTALIKAFLDRFVYFNCSEHRPMVRGMRAAVVVPFEEEDLATASPTVAIFEKSLAYLEMDLTGSLLAPGVTRRGEVRDCEPVMRQAADLGRRLVSAE